MPPPASLNGGVWMKGDLHLHSHHSSDAADNPLKALIAFAETVGMDYFIATDHDNHVDGDVAHHTWTDPDYRSDSMVMLYGAEWTTHRGHGNAIAARPYDHQRLYDVRDERDADIGEVVKDLGIHLSANHPAGADTFSFSYDIVKSIEVWNSSIWSKNASSLLVWDDLLKAGRRLTVRGGSDAHHNAMISPTEWTTNFFEGYANFVGTPTTWVYARERTGDAVIEALDNGRVSVSANPLAERVELYADTNADGEMDLMMGDIGRGTGAPVTFRVDLVGGNGLIPLYTILITKDGAEFDRITTAARRIEFSDTPAADGRSYYRVEVMGLPTLYPQVPGSALTSGRMIALSNPIYFNFDPAF
ncbi:MAG TPA: CehA/McbA family metallohydrolase [Pseudolabrys sp.]